MQQGLAAYSQGRIDPAISTLRAALAKEPSHVDANHLLALLLSAREQFVQAAFYAQRAVAAAPHRADCRNTLGVCLHRTGKLDQAQDQLREAARLQPAAPGPVSNLGNVLRDVGQRREAAQAFETALHHDPRHADANHNYALLLLDAGRTDLALPLLRRGFTGAPSEKLLGWELAGTTNYSDECTPQEVLETHRRVGAMFEPARPPSPPTVPLTPGQPVRVGILSPDLRDHATAYFLEPLLRHLDPARVRLHAYSASRVCDQVTLRLKQCFSSWNDIAGLTDEAAAAQIRTDQIHVLLETAGLTRGSRIGICNLRPAPVIAHYLGYPSTTGYPGVAYRIVDEITDPTPPPREGQASFVPTTESLVRLAGCFLCYSPPASVPPIQPRTPGPVRFGAFNNWRKVSPSTARLWANVLAAVPDSTLIVRCPAGGDDWTTERFTDLLIKAGIPAAKIEVLPYATSHVQHLEQVAQTDISLDTSPYNGTTTTCESLWMGVPVVTLAGISHASRVSASLLTASGNAAWIASTRQSYVEIAAQLAQRPLELAQARESLRPRMAASSLCDAALHAQRFSDCIVRLVKTVNRATPA